MNLTNIYDRCVWIWMAIWGILRESVEIWEEIIQNEVSLGGSFTISVSLLLLQIHKTTLTNTSTWQSTNDQFRQPYYHHICIILIIFWHQCWSTPPDSWSRPSRWSWPWWRTRPSRARCASCAGSSRSSSRCSCTWRPASMPSYIWCQFSLSDTSKRSLYPNSPSERYDDISLIILIVTY